MQASGEVHRLMSWGGDGPLRRVEAGDRLTGVEGLPQGNGGRIPEWSLRDCRSASAAGEVQGLAADSWQLVQR